MYEREDLERLVRAARQAASKLKAEHDRDFVAHGLDASADECWAEGERLWEALAPFEDIGRDG
jgi:hypothetical protein